VDNVLTLGEHFIKNLHFLYITSSSDIFFYTENENMDIQ